MFLFNRKARKIEKISKNLQALYNASLSVKLFDEAKKLQAVRSEFKSNSANLGKELLEEIEKRCKEIKQHLDDKNTEYLDRKIDQISELSKGLNRCTTPREVAQDKNSDIVSDLKNQFNRIQKAYDSTLKKSSAVDEEIEATKKGIDNALEKGDKSSWKMLTRKLKSLEVQARPYQIELKGYSNQLTVLGQNIETFIEQNSNLATSDIVEQSSALLKTVKSQKVLVDTERLRYNAESSKEITDDVRKTSDEQDEIINKNFSSDDDMLDDDEVFEEARRAYLMGKDVDDSIPEKKDDNL